MQTIYLASYGSWVELLKFANQMVTLSPVEYLTAEYSTFKTFEKTIIIINLDPPLKVLEGFQRLPCFPRKMVLYSSNKFGILKPSTIISKLIRFDLGF